MNTEHQEETATRDVRLPAACAACDGEVAIRFTPGRARGVCLVCHLITDLGVARGRDGLHLVQMAGGAA